MPLYFFYTIVQKKSKTTKSQIKGGSCLKSSSLLEYFDCFQSNHIVGCCNIIFYRPVSSKEGKILFCKQCFHIFVVLFCATAVVSLQRLANFSPCDPPIFCFSPTRYTHSLLKNEFFSNIHGWISREEQRKEIFREMRFPNKEAKRYFYTVLRSKSIIFAVPVKHRWETCKEIASLLLIKNKEPGERIVRFWTLILMFNLNENCQSLGHIKMQKLPWNTPLFLVFWPHPEPP